MRFRFKGLREYVEELTAVSNLFAAEYAVEKALDAGADVVADETRKALETMNVDNRPYVEPQRDSITELQRQGLLNSFGVTPIQHKRNMIDVKTGFDGYNKIGQPNVVIARSLEAGTSFMPKYPIISRASRKARTACLEAMQKSLTEDIEKTKRVNKKGH